MTVTYLSKDDEAKKLEDNLGLVGDVVRRMNPRPSEYEEYFQEGCIGLLNAIRKHDPARGKLSTLAYRSIKNQILNHLKKQGRYTKIKQLVYEENSNRK